MFIRLGIRRNGLLIIKWDESGNPIWNETWGLNWGESGLSIWGTGSNLYICCGVTSNYGAGGQDLLLIKWDNSGNQIWNWYMGRSENDGGEAICGNTNYIYTCGFTQSFGIAPQAQLIIAWDFDGNQLWNQTWGQGNQAAASCISCDSSFIYMGGYSWSLTPGIENVLLMKWDLNGTLTWTRTWGYALGSNEATGIWADNASIYMCGYTFRLWNLILNN